MSFFIKKNPYDILKAKLIQKKLSEEPILDSNLKSRGQKFTLNKILKGTKSILKNKIKFSGYMKEYQSIVAKSTCRSPDIKNYPLISKKFSPMIPLKTQRIKDIMTKDFIKKLLNKPMNLQTFTERYKNNLSLSLSIENNKKKYKLKLYKKPREKEKLLSFSDFFYKWNSDTERKSSNNSKLNENKFSTLSYE